MHRRGVLLSVVALIVGGAAALLASSQAWLRVVSHRAAPLPDVSARILGRTVEPAVAGLGVVALAGAVAVLATAGRLRQLVGVVLAVAGGVLIWRCTAGASVSRARAHELLATTRTGAVLGSAADLIVHRQPGWPAAAALGGALIAATGLVVLVRGRRWSALSARYEAPIAGAPAAGSGTLPPPRPDHPAHPSHPDQLDGLDSDQRRQRADAALWRSVDRGEDPTA